MTAALADFTILPTSEITALRADVARLTEEHAALRALWRYVVECEPWEGDLDGYDLIEVAEAAGLMRREPYNSTSPEHEGIDADDGDMIYVLTPLGAALAAEPEADP